MNPSLVFHFARAGVGLGGWFSMTSCQRAEGSRNVGPYQIKNLVGSGNFGEVWRGVNTDTGEAVAIKQMRKDGIDRADVEREILVMQAVEQCGGHPHLVSIRQQEETDHHYNLVLELAEGGELFDFLAGGGYIRDEQEVARLIQELALGLYFLHENGIVHQVCHVLFGVQCRFHAGITALYTFLGPETRKLHVLFGNC